MRQILTYTLEILRVLENEGENFWRTRTHRSCTINPDVNLQPGLTRVARGVGYLKWKVRNKGHWVLANTCRRRGIQTAIRKFTGLSVTMLSTLRPVLASTHWPLLRSFLFSLPMPRTTRVIPGCRFTSGLIVLERCVLALLFWR